MSMVQEAIREINSPDLMNGFPPAAETQVSRANMLQPPYNRWAFHHLRELVPTINVWAGDAYPKSLFQKDEHDLSDLLFEGLNGNTHTILEWLKATQTDGFMVLRKGKIAFQYHAPGVKPHEPHLLMSVTKAVNGLLATDLIAQGKLDGDALVTSYVPELKGSAWEDATIQQTLDMSVGVDYLERYDDIPSNLGDYVVAAGMAPQPEGYNGPRNIYDYLKTLKKQGDHGAGFKYQSVHPEVTGWVIQRITGQKINDYLSERIWQPMGAAHDAYFVADSNGMGMSGGAMNATLSDMARFGEMVRNRGYFNGRQILDPKTFDLLFVKDYPVKTTEDLYGLSRPGYSYHNYWWIPNNADNVIEAWGINGQMVHINPTTETVIVKQSSRKQQSNDTNQVATVARNAFAAIDHFWGK